MGKNWQARKITGWKISRFTLLVTQFLPYNFNNPRVWVKCGILPVILKLWAECFSAVYFLMISFVFSGVCFLSNLKTKSV